MNSTGKSVRLSIFGKSHGRIVGCLIDGLPAGLTLDHALIERELMRRSGRLGGAGATERREEDGYDIVAGLFNGKTDGTGLVALFSNNDADAGAYLPNMARPSHADYAAYVKYGGANDYNGGGQFSGRMTLPLVFAGAVAKQLLLQKNISVFSHILSIGEVCDSSFSPVMEEAMPLDLLFPVIDGRARKAMLEAIEKAKQSGDTLGGSVECAVLGLPVGVGEPFFDSVESVISHILFAIPGLRGIDFMDRRMYLGSETNDSYTQNGKTLTNNSWGVNGGIANGMPLMLRAFFRPIPSHSREQTGYDMANGRPVTMKITGRHDTCILPRGAVAVEAAAAFALLDLMRRGGFI